MNAKMMLILPVLFAISAAALAQQNPPRRDGEGFDNPAPYKEGFKEGYKEGPGPGNRPMGGGMNPGMFQVEMMRNWLDLIDRYARLSRDPVASGIAAVVGANDVLRTKPPEQAIEFFTKLMPEIKNEAVIRVIRLQLIELYNKTGQSDKALEHLKTLMLAAPEGMMPKTGPSEKPEKEKP